MSHGNATLSPLGRLKLARFHVQSGYSIRAGAERFQVSTTTVLRWSGRYRQVLAPGRQTRVADMEDRSSRPHRAPARTHVRVERRFRHLRVTRRLGPVQIAGRVGVPASTVHRVSVRSGLNRLDHMDRATEDVIRRYERANPGDLIHVHIKKFALIPQVVDGRFTAGKQPPQGAADAAATPTCIQPRMTAHGWPIQKSTTMSPSPPPSPFGSEPQRSGLPPL